MRRKSHGRFRGRWRAPVRNHDVGDVHISDIEEDEFFHDLKKQSSAKDFGTLNAHRLLEQSSRNENSFREGHQGCVNSKSNSENGVSTYKSASGKSAALLEIQNMKQVVHVPSNMKSEKCLPSKKAKKFPIDQDLLKGVQNFPTVKKIKPKKFLNSTTSNFFSKISNLSEVLPKKSAMVDCSVLRYSDREAENINPCHLLNNSKTHVCNVTSEIFERCHTSFVGDVTSKNENLKVTHRLNSTKALFSGPSLNLGDPQDEIPEIESSGSSDNNAFSHHGASKVVLTEEMCISEDSDCSYDPGKHSFFKAQTMVNGKISERKCEKSVHANTEQVIPQVPSMKTKKGLSLKKSSKFSTNSNLKGVQVTPRVRTRKPERFINDTSCSVFYNTFIDSNISQRVLPVPKKATTSDSFTLKHSLTNPEMEKIELCHLSCDSKGNSVISEKCKGFQISFVGDFQMTSKAQKVKVRGCSSSKKKISSNAMGNLEASQGEIPEIESSGSLGKDMLSPRSAGKDVLTEEGFISDDSDYSSDFRECNFPQAQKVLDRKIGEAKFPESENLNHTSVYATEGRSVPHKSRCAESEAVAVPRKGSDWVKSIKLHEESVSKLGAEGEVHSERKRKYLPGGLAEKAHKLANWERSSVVMWNFQRNSKIGLEVEKYLSLKIQIFSVVDALVIARCEILEDSNICFRQGDHGKKPPFNFAHDKQGTKVLSKEDYFFEECDPTVFVTNCGATSCFSGRKEKENQSCLVVIKLGMWRKLKLTVKSIIKIFQPWKTSWVDCFNSHVLFCTYYIEVLRTSPATEKSLSEKVLYSRTSAIDSVQEVQPGCSSDFNFTSNRKQSPFPDNVQRMPQKNKLDKPSLSLKESLFSRKITRSTKVGDIVVVKGEIIQVHKENSIMWFECDRCQNENLLEDEEGVTYCEVCNKIVSKPVQKMKMEIIVQLPHTNDVLALIQLFSPTVEKIFLFKSKGQPMCGVSDILNTHVGPFICAVTSYTIAESKITYHMQEIS